MITLLSDTRDTRVKRLFARSWWHLHNASTMLFGSSPLAPWTSGEHYQKQVPEVNIWIERDDNGQW